MSQPWHLCNEINSPEDEDGSENEGERTGKYTAGLSLTVITSSDTPNADEKLFSHFRSNRRKRCCVGWRNKLTAPEAGNLQQGCQSLRAKWLVDIGISWEWMREWPRLQAASYLVLEQSLIDIPSLIQRSSSAMRTRPLSNTSGGIHRILKAREEGSSSTGSRPSLHWRKHQDRKGYTISH
ncbi:hypothetical protein BT96DRAFT_1004895 [Gymnopus androsaceus JB14]|uniref:Uncharacterized protein n=1 Tax=Gymnopus androsaceus JB14 TaxID=1447944 RepID=A0A6A4GPL9_9AGAR|nr:hypothetical protein BT96DRAFT_1004895 [Gymnopus androsaceus JB14]